MLSRARLVSKCRAYTRQLQKLQSNFSRTQDLNKLLKNVALHSSPKANVFSWNVSKVLSSIQDQFKNNDSNQSDEIKRRVQKFAVSSGVAAAAVPVAAPSLLETSLLDSSSIEAVKSSTAQDIIIEPIPEPPPVPEGDLTESVEPLVNALGEPTFASLGLGGWSPVGIAQNCFEYLHVTLGIPWWEAIVIGTVIIRLCMFPLVVIAQRNAAKMNNYLPQLQAIQLKMTEARQIGNQLDVARYSQELQLFMKEKQLNPLKNMIVPLAQMPIFISFFMALRQMSNLPVESLRTGGLWWFADLTVPDQFYLMPLITSATLYATIELGTDSAKLSSQNMQTMKYVLRALPLCILPFIVNFPGAILCYWVSTNFISLAQVGFLKIPTVRDYFNIEPLVAHNPSNLPVKQKGFTEGVKDSWKNLKISKEIENRRRLDEIEFQRAGRGPLVKTFKYDPTKQGGLTTPLSAKKR